MCLSVKKAAKNLSFSTLSHLPPCPPDSPRSLYLHKGLFCVEPAPLQTGRWRDRLPILTGPFSHSPLLWSCLYHPRHQALFFHFAPGGGQSSIWSAPPQCGAARTARSRCMCVFQIAEIVLQCLYCWSQANSLTYVLSFDQRFSKSRYVRVESECLCHGFGGGL